MRYWTGERWDAPYWTDGRIALTILAGVVLTVLMFAGFTCIFHVGATARTAAELEADQRAAMLCLVIVGAIATAPLLGLVVMHRRLLFRRPRGRR
jgi:hypothetical protein